MNAMDFATWEPVYEAIIADFGYDRAADRRGRDVLRELLRDDEIVQPSALEFDGTDPTGGTAAIVGGAEPTEADIDLVRDADVVIAASDGAKPVETAGIPVDVQVTDLDGDPETVCSLAASGTVVVVHGHGDNVAALSEQVPDITAACTEGTGDILPTTQVEPLDPPFNFGGFTDGDRAAFLADALGFERLVFPGWDLDDAGVTGEKRRKLRWAARLLRWLELHRDQQFGLLDGRRAEIDLPESVDVDW